MIALKFSTSTVPFNANKADLDFTRAKHGQAVLDWDGNRFQIMLPTLTFILGDTLLYFSPDISRSDR